MQHQYWVTKKSVQRKLGGKEDECVISSDAELDAKLELFKSISDSCLQLQRFIDLYQERLCFLAQEEHSLGRYLKECAKNEKNDSASKIMTTAGKSLAYVGHQRLTVRPPLIRLHHEVETFRARAVVDTKVTVSEMEKSRTEYRAALSWMKSASQQLDPEAGYRVDKFRKAQSYVRSTKNKFDKYTLACLQKVDLLAAARCNMFSHALVPYVNALSIFSTKATEVLSSACLNLKKVEPYDFQVTTELAMSNEDKDKETFFNAEYTDENTEEGDGLEEAVTKTNPQLREDVFDLLGDDFSLNQEPPSASNNSMDDKYIPEQSSDQSFDLLSKDFFMPSSLLQGGFHFTKDDLCQLDKVVNQNSDGKNSEQDKSDAQVTWLSLFDELDPLSSKNVKNQSGDQL